LGEFDRLWFDCMNGDSRETGKLTPEGKPDPSVFSTKHNREGIRVGTAIGLAVRTGGIRELLAPVRFRHFWGVTKNSDLLESLNDPDFEARYQPAQPDKANRYSFRPEAVQRDYRLWPKLPQLCSFSPTNGLMEKRAEALIDIDREALSHRMRMYYNGAIPWEELEVLGSGLTRDAAGFVAKSVRSKVQSAEKFDPARLRRYALRPFDTRWCYYSGVSPLWNRARPDLWAQSWDGNGFLLSRFRAARYPEGPPFSFLSVLSDDHFLAPDASCFPIQLREGPPRRAHANQAAFPKDTPLRANLSGPARTFLTRLGVENLDADVEAAGLVWMHALAIGYSPVYLSENADGIRRDWPRIPLPDSKELLLASAGLGKQIAALLDSEHDVGAVREPPLQHIAAFTLPRGTPLREEEHFAITAGWGHAGQGGVTMPGKGKIIERDYTAPERDASVGPSGARPEGERRSPLLGDRTCDVYLNDVAYWSNIPLRVWEYTIGGYQVIKKWLSYREQKLLGRPLTKEEVRYVQEMARRIAAIILLEPALDANYRAIKEHTYNWPK
jgi:hypothetical protein